MRELYAASWQVSLLQEPEKPQKSQRNCAFPRGVTLTQEERDSHVHGGKWERGKERDTCKRRLEVSEMDKWVSTVPVSAWWPKFYPCIPGAYAERREPIHKCVLCPLHTNCGKHTACAHAHTHAHTLQKERNREMLMDKGSEAIRKTQSPLCLLPPEFLSDALHCLTQKSGSWNVTLYYRRHVFLGEWVQFNNMQIPFRGDSTNMNSQNWHHLF